MMKRPGVGLSANLWDVVLDATATRSLKKGSKLRWGDFEK
jgi:sialic acid synthase SpsE